MKFNSLHSLVGGVLGAAMLIAVPSCSDDHFDINTSGANASAGKTIWENIQANPQLDSLAMILSRVRVFTKEDYSATDANNYSLTYQGLLSQPQTFTMFAPLNGTYNAKYYLDQLDKIDAMRDANSATYNPTAANKQEYNLGVQFAQNHLVRFNFESNTGAQSLHLFNGKIATYDATNGLFNNVVVSKSYGVTPSSNGLLYCLDGESPFAYNIYDYMGANPDLCDSIYNILTDPEIDKRTFNEGASTPGGMNLDGKMEYVDSAFTVSNEIINQCGAQIKNEDSLYIAVIPTNAAWSTAYAKVKNLFKFAPKYNYDYNGSSNLNNSKSYLSSREYTQHEIDSLQAYNAKRLLLTNLYFTPAIFPKDKVDFDGDKVIRSSENITKIVNYALTADSLISTNGKTYYNPNKNGISPLFGENPRENMYQASNGLIFPTTTYDLDPSYSFVSNSQIDMINSGSVGAFYAGNNKQDGTGVYTYLVEGDNYDSLAQAEISGISDMERKAYRYFSVARNNALSIFFPLSNVYSTKYRIRIELLPNRVDVNHRWTQTVKNDEGEEVQEEVAQNTKFYAEIYEDETGSKALATSEDIDVSETERKIYTLFDSFEFSKCYNSLPSGLNNCYPVLKITIPSNKTYQPNRQKFGAALSIVKIYVDPVRE